MKQRKYGVRLVGGDRNDVVMIVSAANGENAIRNTADTFVGIDGEFELGAYRLLGHGKSFCWVSQGRFEAEPEATLRFRETTNKNTKLYRECGILEKRVEEIR